MIAICMASNNVSDLLLAMQNPQITGDGATSGICMSLAAVFDIHWLSPHIWTPYIDALPGHCCKFLHKR